MLSLESLKPCQQGIEVLVADRRSVLDVVPVAVVFDVDRQLLGLLTCLLEVGHGTIITGVDGGSRAGADSTAAVRHDMPTIAAAPA